MFGFGKPGAGIHVNELDDLIGKAEIIDIREPYECSQGMIEGAKNIPMNLLMMDPDNYLKKDRTYYILCLSGGRSGRVCQLLRARGFDIVDVKGGMMSYSGNRVKRPR